MQATQDCSRHDAGIGRQPVSKEQGADKPGMWNLWPQAQVWAAAMVVGQAPCQEAQQVGLRQRNHEGQTLSTEAADVWRREDLPERLQGPRRRRLRATLPCTSRRLPISTTRGRRVAVPRPPSACGAVRAAATLGGPASGAVPRRGTARPRPGGPTPSPGFAGAGPRGSGGAPGRGSAIAPPDEPPIGASGSAWRVAR
jgi:hypothetical protein